MSLHLVANSATLALLVGIVASLAHSFARALAHRRAIRARLNSICKGN